MPRMRFFSFFLPLTIPLSAVPIHQAIYNEPMPLPYSCYDIEFGKERSVSQKAFEEEDLLSVTLPYSSLLPSFCYSDGKGSALALQKASETISSFTISFEKGYLFSHVLIYAFGEEGASLNLTFASRGNEAVKEYSLPLTERSIPDYSTYSNPYAIELDGVFEYDAEISYLSLANFSSSFDAHIAKMVFALRPLPFVPSSDSSLSSPSTSSTSLSDLSSSSSSGASSALIDIGESSPDWLLLANNNNAWPSRSYDWRLKPSEDAITGDVAPVYTLEKKGNRYEKTLAKYLSKEKKCLSYEDVCEYYMAFRDFPPNYSFSSSPKSGDRFARRAQRFDRTMHFSTDYPSKLGAFNDPFSGVYYELDIDVTGSYNGGKGSYTRGPARVVIVEEGLSEEGYGKEPVCYFTLDHYADFVEYYNFIGGFGAPFEGVYNRSGSYENSPIFDNARETLSRSPSSLSFGRSGAKIREEIKSDRERAAAWEGLRTRHLHSVGSNVPVAWR